MIAVRLSIYEIVQDVYTARNEAVQYIPGNRNQYVMDVYLLESEQQRRED
ncbi:hypothetical protein PCURB6_19650 [Paenibacillus curdlanolyticus]|nr:hypothetical protein PCURB6_19650 [Paenibacillus curdlanolyticus]